jgi:hypothetical protein
MPDRGERPELPSARMVDAMCRLYEKGRVVLGWRGKTYLVDYFDDEADAARAYNAAMLPFAGEFARLDGLAEAP